MLVTCWGHDVPIICNDVHVTLRRFSHDMTTCLEEKMQKLTPSVMQDLQMHNGFCIAMGMY
jgi:hypothetical protein